MEISIARGLTELKTLDARIEKTISNSKLVSAKHKSGSKIENRYTKEEFGSNAKADNQSIKALIERRTKIKQAIAKANATTPMEVAGIQYESILDVLERKRSIELETEFLYEMKTQYSQALSKVEQNNMRVDREIQNLLEKKMQQDTPQNKNSNDNNIGFIKSYRELEEWELVDPLNIGKLIEEMENEIDAFESDVDASLSEINALTKIAILD